MAQASAPAAQKKSGIKTFEAGELLFNQGDPAGSLFIIQRGQIRLYLPKGRGIVELAVLRSGEVIGEMAYFDETATRRSCSATALVRTEVIEISFNAFGKTLEGLNPWFKTIIHTLADRLRKTNDKVKALESNSIGYGQAGKVGDYVFFHNADIIKFLSLFYLGLKTHGEPYEKLVQIHMNRMKFYMQEVFNLTETKFEQFFIMLEEEDFINIAPDEDKQLKLIQVKDVEMFRSMMVFLNMQRVLEDSKKMKISLACQKFLKAILEQMILKGVRDAEATADITTILNKAGDDFTSDDIKDATIAGLCDDIVVGEGNKLTCNVQVEKLKKLFPSIKLVNAISRVNETMAGAKKGF
jgi:CRP/FNR family transcriptional regulator, cyclic AMP receptor protein